MRLLKKAQKAKVILKMQFTWIYDADEPKQIKHYVKMQGISRSLLAKIKFQGGKILVNGQIENVLYYLQTDDQLTIEIPDEGEHETLLLDPTPIDIVFEDDHYLVVNKPTNVASIPAQYHPNGTMANRVKYYLQQQEAVNQVIHVVTRLDRDTTGLMLFAKHGFAHALMDQELRNKQLIKRYQALVGGAIESLKEHDWINLPIERDLNSIIKRQTGPAGLASETEYWLKESYCKASLVAIQLHTGRTHQIRVHFAAIGCPLLGDDLYEGDLTQGIERQALHCGELRFTHPFTKEEIHLTLELPADMRSVVEKMTD